MLFDKLQLVGGIVATMSVLIFQAGILAVGGETPNQTMTTTPKNLLYYFIAFVVGYREDIFRQLIRRVADVILTPPAEAGAAPVIESAEQNAWRMSLREHDWGFTAEAVLGRTIPYPRGRVTGGSSAVNATIALRGSPADYDEWAALGNDGWSWKDVLPYFRRLEDDPYGVEEVHGRGGAVAICCWRRDELIPTQRAFFDVCRRLGFPEVTDHNDPRATGVGPFPQNRRERLRLSTAFALPHGRPREVEPRHLAALPREPRPA